MLRYPTAAMPWLTASRVCRCSHASNLSTPQEAPQEPQAGCYTTQKRVGHKEQKPRGYIDVYIATGCKQCGLQVKGRCDVRRAHSTLSPPFLACDPLLHACSAGTSISAHWIALILQPRFCVVCTGRSSLRLNCMHSFGIRLCCVPTYAWFRMREEVG